MALRADSSSSYLSGPTPLTISASASASSPSTSQPHSSSASASSSSVSSPRWVQQTASVPALAPIATTNSGILPTSVPAPASSNLSLNTPVPPLMSLAGTSASQGLLSTTSMGNTPALPTSASASSSTSTSLSIPSSSSTSIPTYASVSASTSTSNLESSSSSSQLPSISISLSQPQAQAQSQSQLPAQPTSTSEPQTQTLQQPQQPNQQQQEQQTSHHKPTNDEVEAVIRQATSTRPTPDGRPPPGKDTRTQLFVGNLPYRVRWQDLKDLFRRSGTVLRADVALSPDNRSRGHGTVLLASAEDAGRAIDMFHGYNWQGRVLEVRLDRMGPQLHEPIAVGMPGAGVGVPGVPGMVGGLGVGAGMGAGLDPVTFGAGGAGGLYVPSPHPPSNFLGASTTGSLASVLAGSSPLLTSSLSTGTSSSSMASSLSTSGGLRTSLTPAQVQILAQQQQQSQHNHNQQQQGLSLQGLSPQQIQQLQHLQQNNELTNDDVYKFLATVASKNNPGSTSSPSNPMMLSSSLFSEPGSGNGGGIGNGIGSGATDIGGLGGARAALRAEYGLSSLERERLGLTPSALSGLAGERPVSGLGGLGGVVGFQGLGMRSLFVGNLPFHCQWQDLKDLFRQAGTILRADVALGPDGRSRGFGTVSFATETDAERAVAMFNGYDFNGRALKVHYDKFSSQTPLPPSAVLTPIQPAAATLLQAAQLQQLVTASSPRISTAGSLGGGLDAFGTRRPTSSGNGNTVGSGSLSAALPLTASLQASVLQQQQERRASAGEISSGRSGSGSGHGHGSSPVSPINAANPGVIGMSPRLARLQQQQDQRAVIGSTSASSSRAGSSNSTTGLSMPPSGARTTGSSDTSPKSSSPLKQSHTSSNSVEPKPTAAASGQTQLQLQSQTLEVSSKSRRGSSATSISTSPRAHHPAHPGTIALPPPPLANAFPYPYPAMGGPISPIGHPGSPLLYSAYVQMQSPVTQYPPPPPSLSSFPTPGAHGQGQMVGYASSNREAAQQGQGAQMVTPYGLPPITPSMPSFSFVPQPSPADGPVPVGGSSAIPPAPADGQEHAGSAQHVAGQGHGMPQDSRTPMSYPYNTAMGMASPPIHFPPHMFSPFTPGTALSPGAFWGMPAPVGHGAPAHLNPAGGSPVVVNHAPHPHPLHHAFGPGSQSTSPATTAAGGFYPVMGEPSGYFPPVPPQHQQQDGRQEYFPPVPPHAQSSGVVSEAPGRDKDRDAGCAVLTDGVDGADHPSERERTRSSSSSFSVQSSAPGEEEEGRASSVATSWRSSDERVPTKGTTAVYVDTASSTATHKSLVGKMAGLRLGDPPKGKKSARNSGEEVGASDVSGGQGGVVERGTAVEEGTKDAKANTDSKAGAPVQQQTRSHSMGETGSSRPQTLQKTHSDETGERVSGAGRDAVQTLAT